MSNCDRCGGEAVARREGETLLFCETCGVGVSNPVAYLTDPRLDSRGQCCVVYRGVAVAKGDLDTMVAYLKQHWPKVAPRVFRGGDWLTPEEVRA